MRNNKKIITFVVLKKSYKMKVSEEKQKKIDELVFYLTYYKELSVRSPRMKKTMDNEIRDLMKEIKKMD